MKSGIIILTFITILLLGGCNPFNDELKVKGYGSLISEERVVENFKEIQMAVEGDIYLYQSDSFYFEVEAQKNILEVLETKVIGDKLTISYSADVNEHDGIFMTISMPELTRLDLTGVGDVEASDSFKCEDLKLGLSGVGNIEFNELYTENIDLILSGVGNIFLAGPDTTKTLDIDLTGVGNLDLYDLKANEVDVVNSSTGNCKIYAISKLSVIISGIGDIYYRGNPVIDPYPPKITGLGNLIDDN